VLCGYNLKYASYQAAHESTDDIRDTRNFRNTSSARVIHNYYSSIIII